MEAEAEDAGGKLGDAVLACLGLLHAMVLRMLPQPQGVGGRAAEAPLEGAMVRHSCTTVFYKYVVSNLFPA